MQSLEVHEALARLDERLDAHQSRDEDALERLGDVLVKLDQRMRRLEYATWVAAGVVTTVSVLAKLGVLHPIMVGLP